MTHDVVVVGGGLGGTMAVLTAAARGLDVAWITDDLASDAQSLRWHAHLHRGRLYHPQREADLIAELKVNSAFWWSEPVKRFHTSIPTVAIGHDQAWVREFREVLEGNRGELVAPRYLRPDAVAVRTDEAILDALTFLGAARAAAAARARTVAGRCVAVRRSGGLWSAIANGEEIRAHAVVLATGIEIDALLPDGVRLDHPQETRLSRMLVLRGRLPRAAAIVPSRASGGLFFASRELGGRTGERVWLVSDGFNSPGSRSPGALTDAWWACSIVERMYAHVREDLLDRTLAAAYIAPKSRLAASPTQVPAVGFSADLPARIVALTPSKGTASPGAAIEALAALHPDPVPMSDRLAQLADCFVRPPRSTEVLAERWSELDPRVSTRELRRPGIAALDAAVSLFPRAGRPSIRREPVLAGV